MTDTKLRMSIDQMIIDALDELNPKVVEATRHLKNGYAMRTFKYDLPDSEHSIKFVFSPTGWNIVRISGKDGIFDKQDKDCWEVENIDEDTVRVSTYGKMCVDINREILPLLNDLRVQVDLLEDPVYCPTCDHCGETGCCGFVGFLEKHVRGKTNCLYETEILNDLEEFLRDKEVD